MIKNKIYSTLGALTLALFYGCGKEKTEITQNIPQLVVEKPNITVGRNFGYNLKVEPKGEYDKDFSSKVLELSKLVMTKPKGDYYIDSVPGGFLVSVRLEENDKHYDLLVYDSSENNGAHLPEPFYSKDKLSLTKFVQENDKTRVWDFDTYGLDGNCDGYSFIINKEESGKPIDLIEYDPVFGKTENKEIFDKKFRETVDELLEIYQRE